MARPKKAGKPQGEKTAKHEAEPTPMKSVKVKEVTEDPRPLKKGDTFLFIKDG